jgi:hypothetical protein
MSLLISLLITVIALGALLYLVDRLPLSARIRQIVRVTIIIIGILVLLRYLNIVII